MAGRALAVTNGKALTDAVVAIGQELDLEVHEQFEVARRLWGAKRQIDVVLIHKTTRKTLGVECKYQGVGGSAEEKIPSTILDIAAWPIDGIVVFAGVGFTENMKAYLISTGKAVDLEDLEPWLRLFFGLEIPEKQGKKGASRQRISHVQDNLLEIEPDE